MPEDGVKGFPKDFRINQFSDILDPPKKSSECMTCDLCASGGSQAVKYCGECQKYFCQYCSIRHRMSVVLKSHILTDVLHSGRGQPFYCQSHSNEPIKYFCQSCDTCICILCLLGNHEHHLVASIQEKQVYQKDSVASCLQHVETQITFLNNRIFAITCNEGQSRSQLYGAKVNQLSKKLKPLRNIEMQFVGLNHEKDLCFQYLEQFKMIKHKLESIITRNANVLSKSYSTILEEIKLIDVQFELSVSNPKPSYITPASYVLRNKDIKLGKHSERGVNSAISSKYRTPTPLDFCITKLASLSMNQKPYNPLKYEVKRNIKLLFKVGGYGRGQGHLNLPFGITFDKDDNLIVAENGSGRIQKFDVTGRSIQCQNLENGFPRCICTGRNNEIYITDESTKSIRIVGTMSERVLEKARDIIHFPYGIATLRDSHLIISDKIYEKITIIRPTGELVLQFGCHGYQDCDLDNPSYLATDGDNILVSDSGHHQIKLFDKNGKFLRKIGSLGSSSGELRYPKGIAITRKGEIIVADSGNHRVVMFSRDGDYMTTLLDSSDNIERPIDVACTPSGFLAVAMPDKHIVHVYRFHS